MGLGIMQSNGTIQITYNGQDVYKELETRRQNYLWLLRVIGKMQKRHPEWDWSWLYIPYGDAEYIDLDKLNKVQCDLYHMCKIAKEDYEEIYFELKGNHCI